ncbi:hypothetical protein AK88_01379 [Plasmodium fragile]|uniref:Uncharacterized protein n=1 Tax=Plasmodium fragile TaxID=5857 RepID=A0A0D9QP60_PLAFR|nr:uncharacterized protein AK88_01379 [Plasmodium fragile]KJP88885.1 hypothetical protein AK88_01379 [Plasmodium fragile]
MRTEEERKKDNIIIAVFLGIHISGFDSFLSFKFPPRDRRSANSRWKRTLVLIYAEGHDGILNDNGLSIVQVEEMCKNKDTNFCDKIYGLSLHDMRDLFVELTNFIMYADYEEQVKMEKKIFTSTQRALTFMKQNIKKETEELVNTAKKYIDELFGSYDILNKQEWEDISKLNLFLDLNGEQDVLLINGRHIFFHVMNVKFRRIIPLNTQDVWDNITELYKHNKNIFDRYEKKIAKIEKDIQTYLGHGGNRFPLNYTQWNNSYINITQNVAVRAFLDDFYNYFSRLERKILYQGKRWVEVDVSFLDGTLEALISIIKSTIEQKTVKLFSMLNKIFEGDLRSILGFFSHLFDKERKKNKLFLKSIEKEKTGDEYDNNFLFDVESLYVEEKKDIQKALSKFKHFMRVNLGIDISSTSVRLLKNKIEEEDVEEQEKQIMNIFSIIVHELLCRKEVIEFVDLVNLLKKNAKTCFSYLRNVLGCLTPPKDNCLFIETRKLIPVVSKCTEIREKNNCHVKQDDSEESIVEIMKDIKNAFFRYRIAIKILLLLIEDLKVAKELNGEYEMLVKEKEMAKKAFLDSCEDSENMEEIYKNIMQEWNKKLEAKNVAMDANKNAIVFYLCLIKEFKLG